MKNLQSIRRGGLLLLTGALFSVGVMASPGGLTLEQAAGLQRTGAAQAQEGIGNVRTVVLTEVARALGARIGFAERSGEILAILDRRAGELDSRFDFGRLVIGNNVLPPVITESRDVVSVEVATMRVAGSIFRIDEPARFALPSPTWRNWLWLGLDSTPAAAPDLAGSLPVTPAERDLWAAQVREGYAMGREQAQAVFDLNMATLERVYSGMRRFYDLHHRGMVSAPVIAAAHSVVRQEGEGTIAVGDTIFRITAPVSFREHRDWLPLDKRLEN